MNNRGFTLIELLAVIVILAIIALITIPMVSKSTSNVTVNSTLQSAKLFVNAVDEALLSQKLEKNIVIEDGWYFLNKNGNLCNDEMCSIEIEIPASNKPTSGNFYIKDNKVKECDKLEINGYQVSYGGNGAYMTTEDLPTFENGEVVYFNVETGNACTKEDYGKSRGMYETLPYEDTPEFNDNGDEMIYPNAVMREDYGNSATGYNGFQNLIEDEGRDANQNGCLKFYAFLNKEDSTRINLLLDHDIFNVKFNDDAGMTSASYYNVEPLILLSKLYEYTKDWQGTLPYEKYKYYNDKNKYLSGEVYAYDGIIEYTINYEDFKARLITAEEVAKITSADFFDITSNDNSYYFANLRHTTDGILNKPKEFYKFGWLYDRLVSFGAETEGKYGVPNDPICYPSRDYWTASRSNGKYAWMVEASGKISAYPTDGSAGIRPVIEVLKVKFKDYQ